MKRIVIHWSAGTSWANDLDRDHYHYLIEGDGTVIEGKRPVSANAGPLVAGRYAAHTLGCNTGSIGVALCGMAGAVERPFSAGKYPINAVQLDAAAALVARLCAQYGIAVTPETVLTHAEVQPTLGIKQRGKWDIARLPWRPDLIGPKACGDYIRSRVIAMMALPASVPPPAVETPPDQNPIKSFWAAFVAAVLTIITRKGPTQ